MALTTPGRSGSSRRSRSNSTSPPRILNAPVGVWFSCFTHTSVPSASASSGQAYVGVTGTCWRTSSVARSSSSEREIGGQASVTTRWTSDVVGLGRQVVDELLGERRADRDAARRQPRQEPVVVTAALAEPAAVGGERQARDDDDVERRRVDVARARRRRSGAVDGRREHVELMRRGTTRNQPARVRFGRQRLEQQHPPAGGEIGDVDDPRPDAVGAGEAVGGVGGDRSARTSRIDARSERLACTARSVAGCLPSTV